MFLGTLGISQKKVKVVLQKKSALSLLRDHHPEKNRNKLDHDVQKKIEEHLNKLPTCGSHYRRKYTQKRYFEQSLTIKKVYELFKQDNPKVKVGYTAYRSIVDQYSIGFYKPKNDKCSNCTIYENSSKSEGDIDAYHSHRKLVEESRKSKDSDKETAKNNPACEVIICDMQAVQNSPKAKSGEFFYLTKISCYNYTIYNLGTGKVCCYMWNSGDRGKTRGSDEISSALRHHILLTDKNKSIKELIVWADTCAGQNRNQFLTAMLLRCINECKYITKITLKYFVPGHNQSECDHIHSVLERLSKPCDVYLPDDYKVLARSKRYDVFDLGEAVKIYDIRGDIENVIKNRNLYRDDEDPENEIKTVSWMRNRITIIEKGKTSIKMGESYDTNDVIELDVLERPYIRKPRNLQNRRLEPSFVDKKTKYIVKGNRREQKKTVEGLQNLCKKNIIPLK